MSSVRQGSRLRQPASGCGPFVIGCGRQPEPFVGHPKIAVATDSDRVGPYGSDFLRNHPDIGLLAAIVREAVITETVVEPAQQYDIVLQPDTRPPPAAASPTPKAAAASETPAAPECGSSMSAAGEPS